VCPEQTGVGLSGSQTQNIKEKICFHQGVPEFDNSKGEMKQIILDGLVNYVYSKDVCNILTKGSHHRNHCYLDNPKPVPRGAIQLELFTRCQISGRASGLAS